MPILRRPAAPSQARCLAPPAAGRRRARPLLLRPAPRCAPELLAALDWHCRPCCPAVQKPHPPAMAQAPGDTPAHGAIPALGLVAGKRALVSGGRRGIGRAIALALAAQGADVGIADIVDDDVLHEVAELVRAKGRRASVHIADMSSVEQIGRAVEAFVAEHGTVDIVVNSTTISGYVESPGFWDTTEEFYDKQMDVHLKASFFLCTQPTLPPPAPTHSHTEGSEPPRARSFHPRGLCSSPRGQRDA